ncbi:histidine-rich glycoprotein-like [Penaeus chinensis]|uniref:histidine-rich glycoprotein-like n=1 Tax=Penaeus chinensis TaxID=139456 RepID=UPI001FB6B101|nr:histidine-rich glycoprotein-like [Penaeus chinensis]
MKYLVFVLLVAAACASEVKREAAPSTGYLYHPHGSHHSGHSHDGGYRPLHKRSAEAEADPSNLYYPGYPRNYQYSYPSYHHHKRSADPAAETEPSYRPTSYHHHSYTPYQHTYTPYVNHPHKRSAEPSTIYQHHTPYNPYVHHPHKRSAEPSTIYTHYNRHHTPYVYRPHKRSAEANPSYHHAYNPSHYHGVISGHDFHYRY